MRWPFILLIAFGFNPITTSAAAPRDSSPHPASSITPHPIAIEPRTETSLDRGWKFTRADPNGADAAVFDDHSWRTLNVPHDWSIDGPFDEANPTGRGGGYLPAGIGWYRRHLNLPSRDSTRRVVILFDGVMANSDAWINGFHLGHRPYGYVSFWYDLTGHLAFGPRADNVIAVRVDDSAQPASRWYAGAGIYRHVHLITTNPVHIGQWGVFVTTTQVSSGQALVHIQTTVINQAGAPKRVRLQTTLEAPTATLLPPAIVTDILAAGASRTFTQTLHVPRPQLWDLNHPRLYRALSHLSVNGALADNSVTPFGIREARFDAATGFHLNGSPIKIKGVCLHGDAGALGVAVPLSAWERRLQLLKQVGCNAIRTSHNPPAPEFLSLCDRMGFLVMDELFDCWKVGKNRYDYHLYFDKWATIDVRDTVQRDRNHPSVILYSAGNEIHDTPDTASAKRILTMLLAAFHQWDPSRPVTQALFRPNASRDYDDGLADMLDVIGQNYREPEILAAHAAKPQRKILGTENGLDRRVWLALRDNPPYAGQFLWSGFDYLGESRGWPIIAAGSGLFDRTGRPRASAFQRQSWWSQRPMVHIVRRTAPTRATPADPGFEPLTRAPQESADWTPANLDAHPEEVDIYSNCDNVELSLNGKSLGSKALPEDASPRVWKVSFEPGILKAIGTNHGVAVASDELQTSGKPAKIQLITDPDQLSPEWDSVGYLTAIIEDNRGVPVPTASNLIRFNVTGPGVIAAVDNGDLSSHESFHASPRRAFHGRCIAILRATASTGRITVTATALGLTSSSTKWSLK